MVSINCRGDRVALWCWVNFQCRGVLLIRMIVGQGPIALAVGAGGFVWTFFLSFLFLSPSLGDGQILTEILSQKAVKSKTIKQPTINCNEPSEKRFKNCAYKNQNIALCLVLI